MTINVHNKGDLVRISCDFTNIAGTATDPTTVELKVTDPSGNTATYTYAGGDITKASTGSFYKDVEADEEGDWLYHWLSSGDAQGADEGQFVVQPTRF